MYSLLLAYILVFAAPPRVRAIYLDAVACGCYLQRHACKQPITNSTQCEVAVPFDLQNSNTAGQFYAVYAGDSIMRGTFAAMVVSLNSASISPHTVYSFDLAWYHNDQFVCCKILGSTPHCEWGRQGLEFNTTAHEAATSFLERGAQYCAIFVWSPSHPDVDLGQLKLGKSKLPDFVVINPGLHHVKKGPLERTRHVVRDTVKNMFTFLSELTAIVRSRPPPLIIFQESTSVIPSRIQEKYSDFVHRLDNSIILQYNYFLREEVSRQFCTHITLNYPEQLQELVFVSGYIHAYAMSVQAPMKLRKDDGLHFERGFYKQLNDLYYQLALYDTTASCQLCDIEACH